MSTRSALLALLPAALAVAAAGWVRRPSPAALPPPPAPPAPAPPPPPAPLPSSPPRHTTLTAPTQITAPRGNSVTLLPGAGRDLAAPPPLVTVLHATCITPEENCAFLRALADQGTILVCPAGETRCTDGSRSWETPARVRAAYVEESAAAAERALDLAPDPRRGDVLFGSSRGAFVARDVIYEGGGQKRWTGLVLVGAAIALDPEKVRRAGVERVLLAAPDFDGAAPTMRQGQIRLCASGIPARFVSLGPHPHGMRNDSPAILARHLDWVRGGGDPGPCPRRGAGG